MGAPLPPFMEPRREPGQFERLPKEDRINWSNVIGTLLGVSALFAAVALMVWGYQSDVEWRARTCAVCVHAKHPGHPCGAWYRDRQYVTRQCECAACPAQPAEEVGK